MRKNPSCPNCGRELYAVTQHPASLLNEHQFLAIRAGDYYCKICTSDNPRRSGHRYWWKQELTGRARIARWLKRIAGFKGWLALGLQAIVLLFVIWFCAILVFCL